jgi:hypothetical protein
MKTHKYVAGPGADGSWFAPIHALMRDIRLDTLMDRAYTVNSGKRQRDASLRSAVFVLASCGKTTFRELKYKVLHTRTPAVY